MNEEIMTENTDEAAEEASRPGESKQEKFLRLAPPRINKVLHSIESLGKLSGSSYEYTPEQIEKMLGAIDKAVEDLRGKFVKSKAKEDEPFSF